MEACFCRFSKISLTCNSLIRAQSISSQTGLVHEAQCLVSSLSANLLASVHAVSNTDLHKASAKLTLLDVKVPCRTAKLNYRICDALKVQQGHLVRLQRHIGGAGGQSLQQVPKLWEEGKNIAGMALVSEPSYLKNLNTRCLTAANTLANNDTCGSETLL